MDLGGTTMIRMIRKKLKPDELGFTLVSRADGMRYEVVPGVFSEYSVVVCYRREETRHLAGCFTDRLAQQSIPFFIDIETPPGVDCTVAIRQAIAMSSVLVALIGKQWADLRRRRDPGTRIGQWRSCGSRWSSELL